jgi:hypothetical protein
MRLKLSGTGKVLKAWMAAMVSKSNTYSLFLLEVQHDFLSFFHYLTGK